MTRGRKPKFDRPARLSVNISSALIATLEEQTFDPAENRIPYSARANLIEKLLRDHFRGQDGAKYHRLVGDIVAASSVEATNNAIQAVYEYHKEVTEQTEAFDNPPRKLDLSTLLS